MTAQDFVYWLNGALELGQLKELNTEQVKIVQDHLNLVLNKVTPQYYTPTPGIGIAHRKLGDVSPFEFPKFEPGQVIC